VLRSGLINELNPYRLQGLRGQRGGAPLFGIWKKFGKNAQSASLLSCCSHPQSRHPPPQTSTAFHLNSKALNLCIRRLELSQFGTHDVDNNGVDNNNEKLILYLIG